MESKTCRKCAANFTLYCKVCKAKKDAERWKNNCPNKLKSRRELQTRICKICRIEKNKTKDNFYFSKKKYKENEYVSISNTCIDCYLESGREKYNSDPKTISKQNEIKLQRESNLIKNKIRKTISNKILFVLKIQKSSKLGESCLKYLPYTIQELKQHLEKQFEPWMNWNNWGRYNSKTWNDQDPSTWTWQIDHIVPQSMFKYTNMSDPEFISCWSITNLRPLSSKKNIIEGFNKIRHKRNI